VLEPLLNELLVLQLVRLPAQIAHLLHRLVPVLGDFDVREELEVSWEPEDFSWVDQVQLVAELIADMGVEEQQNSIQPQVPRPKSILIDAVDLRVCEDVAYTLQV